MAAELEQVTKDILHGWLINEGFVGLHDAIGDRLATRLSECWVIHYVPHCGCDHHGDSAGCDPSCECACKFEVRKIR